MDIHIGLKATVFFAVTGIFTLIYGILACVFLCKQKSVIDSFSRKIVIVYLVGFMCKNTLKCYMYSEVCNLGYILLVRRRTRRD